MSVWRKMCNALAACVFGVALVSFGMPIAAQEAGDLMEMELDDLLNMEVTTASKSAEKLSDAPGVVSVITKEELDRFGGTTLSDILERVPGLVSSSVYMTDRSVISVRGDQFKPNSSHVLLLINGRPIREVLESDVKSEVYESFPVNVIEKIEVIKGPGSVLYGTNAFSGVINVITEEAEKNGLEISGVKGAGSSYGAQGKASFKTGDLSVVAAGRYYQKPDWETTWQYAVPQSDVPGSARVTLPNKGPGAFLNMSFKNLTLMASYNRWDNSYFIADYAPIFESYGAAEWEKRFADLGYKMDVMKNWNMDFNVTYSSAHFETSSWPSTERNSFEVVGEWTNFVRPTEKLNIVFGGLYNHTAGTEDVPGPQGKLRVSDATRYALGFYAQADYQLIESLKAIGGFQANKIEEIDLDVVPRAGLIWYPVERLNVKALYSQAFRAPSINELGLNHPAMRGNPNVQPEKVNTVDVAVNYQTDQARFGISFFRSKQNEVIYQDRINYELPTYDNIGEIDHQGVEVDGKYYLTREVLALGSVLYQVSEDKDGNENVTPIPNLIAKAGFSYQAPNGVTLSVFDVYHGKLDDKYDVPGLNPNPSPEAYHMVNLHGDFNLTKLFSWDMNQDFSIIVQVDNLLDKEVWVPDWGLINGKTMPFNQGRTVWAGFELGI